MLKKEIIVEKTKKIIEILQDYGFSFADANKMLRNKDVKLFGKPIRENITVESGGEITFFYSESMLAKKYEVVFENDQTIIIFKHAGIEVEGEKGLESALHAIAVHRLDRNTEGLMVFAKNEQSAEMLTKAIKQRKIHKYYIAEVVGKFAGEDKVYSAFLVKDSKNSYVKIFDKPTKNAVKIETKIRSLKTGNESSVLEIELLTGKTHQIRAHLAYLGNPIIGDGKYGKNEINKKFKENKQKLACFKLIFENIGILGLDNCEFVKYPKWTSNIISGKG